MLKEGDNGESKEGMSETKDQREKGKGGERRKKTEISEI